MSYAMNIIEQNQALDAKVRAECLKKFKAAQFPASVKNPYKTGTKERVIWNDEFSRLCHEKLRDVQ